MGEPSTPAPVAPKPVLPGAKVASAPVTNSARMVAPVAETATPEKTKAEVTSAMTEPPTTTRAYFRGRCLAKWPDDIVAANWDSLILDVGTDPLRRIPMMEPLKGSRAHVEALFAQCSTPGQLVEQLGS